MYKVEFEEYNTIDCYEEKGIYREKIFETQKEADEFINKLCLEPNISNATIIEFEV
jgi:hypothetical protein